MFKSILKSIISGFKKVFSSHDHNSMPVKTTDAILSDEIHSLCQSIDEAEKSGATEDSIKEIIIDSFNKISSQFSKNELDENYVWIRFIKISTKAISSLITEFLEYADSTNYRVLFKSLTDLLAHRNKSKDSGGKKKYFNTEAYLFAFCHHILDNINPADAPSYFTLASAEEKNDNYEAARKYYNQLLSCSENPLKAIVSLASSYSSEAKKLLSENTRYKRPIPYTIRKKIRDLNSCERKLYEKYLAIYENKANSLDATEEFRIDYLTLATMSARFERNTGNYEKAYSILYNLSDDYPEIYRLYLEKAMLLQFKPYDNCRYDISQSISFFKKAYDSFMTLKNKGRNYIVTLKSILMPLANAYHTSGMDDDALHICDTILQLDKDESRAKELRDQLIMS